MAGILVLAVYGFFWWGCWKFSGLFNYTKAKNPMKMRKWICFWILMIPMYFHIVEFVIFTNACSNALVYFPDEKIERPKSLITNYHRFKNVGEHFRHAEKFDYLISPKNSDYRNGLSFVDLKLGKKQITDYVVYKDVKKLNSIDSNVVNHDISKIIIKEANYAVFENIHKEWGFGHQEIYIYDYDKQKKVSGFTKVYQSIDSSSFRNFFTIVRMPNCRYKKGLFQGKYLSIKSLLENTFKKRN